MAHQLPPLPYDFAALEPHIDAQTMQIHHGKHHQAYVNNLNAALEKHPDLQAKSAEDLIKNLAAVPDDIRTAVRNNGGGHVNHSMFWKLMAPGAGGAPTGAARRRHHLRVRRLRRVQGTVRQGWRRPLRQWMGVAHRHEREAVDREQRESGQSVDGRQEGHPRSRRLGARLLSEVPEPPARLHRRVVECRELGRGRHDSTDGKASYDRVVFVFVFVFVLVRSRIRKRTRIRRRHGSEFLQNLLAPRKLILPFGDPRGSARFHPSTRRTARDARCSTRRCPLCATRRRPS